MTKSAPPCCYSIDPGSLACSVLPVAAAPERACVDEQSSGENDGEHDATSPALGASPIGRGEVDGEDRKGSEVADGVAPVCPGWAFAREPRDGGRMRHLVRALLHANILADDPRNGPERRHGCSTNPPRGAAMLRCGLSELLSLVDPAVET